MIGSFSATLVDPAEIPTHFANLTAVYNLLHIIIKSDKLPTTDVHERYRKHRFHNKLM